MVHRTLAPEAADQGVRINRLAFAKLAVKLISTGLRNSSSKISPGFG